MSATHLIFLGITMLAPIGLTWASRRRRSKAFDLGVARAIAGMLLALEVAEMVVKAAIERQPIGATLPMHLCDWALVTTAAALWWQGQRWFEVAYFWGLAGTFQGLVTPAIGHSLALWRQIGFFAIHSGIVVGVLFLMLVHRLRPVPASLPRVLFWSEVYLLTALSVDALTGLNYGYLAHPPSTPSLLDVFPKPRWQYVATINGVGLIAFTLLYLPWWIADVRRRSS